MVASKMVAVDGGAKFLSRPYDVGLSEEEREVVETLRKGPDPKRKPLDVKKVRRGDGEVNVYPFHVAKQGDYFMVPLNHSTRKSAEVVLQAAARRHNLEISITRQPGNFLCCCVTIVDLDNVKMAARRKGVDVTLTTERPKRVQKRERGPGSSWDYHNARRTHASHVLSPLVAALEMKHAVPIDRAKKYEQAITLLGISVADLEVGATMFWPGVRSRDAIEAHGEYLGMVISIEVTKGEGPDGSEVDGLKIKRFE